MGIAVIVYYISKLECEKQETQFSLQKLEMEQSNYKQLNEVSKEIKIISQVKLQLLNMIQIDQQTSH